MTMHIERFEDLNDASRASGDILRHIVDSHDKANVRVALKGPSTSPWIDPGMALLAHELSGTNAYIAAIDPKSDRFPHAYLHADPYRRVAGAGNVDTYLKNVRSFELIGVPFAPVSHIEGSHALNFCEHKPFDIIIDHATTLDMVRIGTIGNRSNLIKADELRQFYSYDHSQLAPDGHLVLFSNDTAYGFDIDGSGGSLSLLGLLHESGFDTVHRIQCAELYTFKLPPGSLPNILEHCVAQRFLEMGYFQPETDYIERGDHDLLTITIRGERGVQHYCPDVYIAQKR